MMQDLRIKEIIQRTYNVMSFRLAIERGRDYKAGQFLSVTLKAKPGLKRYLSISSSPTETGYIEFTKKLTESDFSKLLPTLKAGDSLNVEYPFGKFTLNETDKEIAFLSGGIGITPIRSISKYVVDKNLGTDMILLYANRTIQDIAFREDFALMQKQYPALKVINLLSEATPEPGYITGRIDAQIIKDKIADYAERKFFLCGPPAMVEAMKKILSDELSLPAESIVTENFQGY